MADIIPFDGRLPDHLRNVDVDTLNADLTSHVGSGFPTISIKGKVFTVVRDGERRVLPNPKDPDSPATAIDVVLIKANKNNSKNYYPEGYKEGESDGKKPLCFSNDGARPDPSAEAPQSKTCAVCRHNVWGSKISDNGKKVKACQDTVRLAVAAPDKIDDPYLMRVPPASIGPLAEYGMMLKKRGIGYNAVLTKISFDPAMATPKLVFKPVGLLDADSYQQTQTMAASDLVADMLGAAVFDEAADAERGAVPANATRDKTVREEEVIAAINASQPKPEPKPESKPKAAPKPAAKPAAAHAAPPPLDQDGELDLDLSGLGFDD